MFIIAVIGVLLFILSAASPIFGLINYTAILYLRPMEVYYQLAPYPIAKIFAFATILGFLLHYKGPQKIFLNFKQDKVLLILLFVIMMSFSMGWIPRCIEVLDQMVKNVIVYALIVGIVTSEKKMKIFIWSLLVINAILAFNTAQALKFIDPASLDAGRLGGFSGAYFGDSGDFAVVMDTVIPFAFFLCIVGRPLLFRPFSIAIFGLFITALIATRARGGLIAFAVAMVSAGYFGLKDPKWWKKSVSIILAIVAIAGIIYFAPSVFKERAATIISYNQQSTALSRIEYWKIGVKMFLKSPLLGVGAGNYPVKYPDFGGWEGWVVPHSMYIEVLSELGILGFSCLFFLLYFTFKDSINTRRILRQNNKTNSILYSMSQAASISLLAYCVGGFFLTIFTYPILYIIIGINVAIKNITEQQLKKEKLA